jgi:hypothetical protein
MSCAGCPYHITDPDMIEAPCCMAGECIEEEDAMEATSEQRVRINLKQTAKGDAQFDITSEFPDEDQAILHLGQAIDKVTALCKEKGLKIAGDAA